MIKKYLFKDFCDVSEMGYDDSSYFTIQLPNLKEKNAMGRMISETNGNQFDAVDIIIEMAEGLVKEIFVIPLDDSEPITTMNDLSCCEIGNRFIEFFMELVRNGFVPKKK
jgi:hypothetical protein